MNIGSVIDLDLTSGGYAPQSARDRKIADGSEFDKYFTRPNKSKDLKKRDGSVTDTVKEMKTLIRTKSNQVRKLAHEVLAITNVDGSLNVYETVHNIFNFIYKYIKYNLEKGEILQSPRHLWWRGQQLAREKEKQENSGDCDCMAIFAGSCMYQLGIPFALRIAGYTSDNYQHVYCVAYDHNIPVICDPVTNAFNYEKPPVISETYPMESKTMLNGTDIYVLDGIEDLPIKARWQEQADGSLIQVGVGNLGKSAKKQAKAEKKAAKKQAKAEKKAEKKAAKVEKKAEKQQAKAEKKAEKKIQKAEKKAEKLEKKAEKKGGAKAEKLLKKAQTVRENAEIKAEQIKEKAAEKAENKQKKIQEKLEKKTAKIEVKKLKKSGASKEEIKAAKAHLKEVKKEIKAAKKEDGRGFIQKVGKGVKSATMLPVRAAFLMLMNINFRGFATRLFENPQAYDKFAKKWKNIFGGKEAKLKIAINKGKNHKPLFGSKKTNSMVEAEATKEVMEGIFHGFYLGALGVEPTTTTAAACMAAASSALAALSQVLKDMGIEVPESLEDALAAGADCAELMADGTMSEDPENWENPDEYDDADTDGDDVISKKEARKAKRAAKKADKKAAKAEKKAAKAEKKAEKKQAKEEKKAVKQQAKEEKRAARRAANDNENENSEEMANGSFFKKVGEGFKKAVSVVTDISNATQEVRPPEVEPENGGGVVVDSTSKSKQLTVNTDTTPLPPVPPKNDDKDTNWFKENPVLATLLGVAGVGGLALLIYSLTNNNTQANPTPNNGVTIQGIDLL